MRNITNDLMKTTFTAQISAYKPTHSWEFALREGVFAETKEGICRNKDKKRVARVKAPYSKKDKWLHGAASSWYRDYDPPST